MIDMTNGNVPNREEAWELVQRYIDSTALRNHCRAVEAVMRAQAQKSGEDADVWGIIGLVHDLDWERFPQEHCRKTEQILAKAGWPADYIRAVKSHGWQICTDVEPQSLLEKTLYAVDELVGFVTACALVRPSKSVQDLEVKSVRKKWKQKGFAAGVDRGVIERGCTMLGRDLDNLIEAVIVGMRLVSAEIDL